MRLPSMTRTTAACRSDRYELSGIRKASATMGYVKSLEKIASMTVAAVAVSARGRITRERPRRPTRLCAASTTWAASGAGGKDR